MIIGIGTDIIEISRIQKAVENKSFLSKIYTKSEQQLFHNCNYETLAGNFAAKEAVVKAMGTGFKGCSPKEIEILRHESGKPYVVLHNKTKEIFDSMNGGNISISISLSKENAVAFAVIEAKE